MCFFCEPSFLVPPLLYLSLGFIFEINMITDTTIEVGWLVYLGQFRAPRDRGLCSLRRSRLYYPEYGSDRRAVLLSNSRRCCSTFFPSSSDGEDTSSAVAVDENCSF